MVLASWRNDWEQTLQNEVRSLLHMIELPLAGNHALTRQLLRIVSSLLTPRLPDKRASILLHILLEGGRCHALLRALPSCSWREQELQDCRWIFELARHAMQQPERFGSSLFEFCGHLLARSLISLRELQAFLLAMHRQGPDFDIVNWRQRPADE